MSFYLSVHSSSNTRPENQPTNFICDLNKTISLNCEYEVGITNISFYYTNGGMVLNEEGTVDIQSDIAIDGKYPPLDRYDEEIVRFEYQKLFQDPLYEIVSADAKIAVTIDVDGISTVFELFKPLFIYNSDLSRQYTYIVNQMQIFLNGDARGMTIKITATDELHTSKTVTVAFSADAIKYLHLNISKPLVFTVLTYNIHQIYRTPQ